MRRLTCNWFFLFFFFDLILVDVRGGKVQGGGGDGVDADTLPVARVNRGTESCPQKNKGVQE